jgi:SNF2 family DNA or RNA helicase
MQTRRKVLARAAIDPTALVIINLEAVRIHSRMAPYGSVRLIRCVECGGNDPDVTPRKCQKHAGELNEIAWSSVVVDEAHRMKDPKSQQTRACWAIQDQPSVKYRIALTGTPVANNVGDLWAIMRGVARRDFPTKTEFIDRFALIAWNQHAVLDIVGVRPDRRDEFNLVVHPRMRRVLKDIVLPELPDKVRVTRTAPMTGKQQRAYRQMEEDMMAEVEDGVIVSSTNLVKATRLLQFSSAFAKLNHERLTPKGLPTVELFEPSPKIDVMEEILDELGDRQVAVCAMSRQLIDLAAARLLRRKERPVSFRLLTGAVTPAERATNVAAFQRGEARVMLFTVQAGGVGVNLTAADTIIFLQRSWSMLENRQAEDRVHRIGSERHESIQVIDIVAPGTIEVGQLRRLADKSRMLEEVVQDRARRAAAGISTDDLDALENGLLGEHLL